MWIEKLVHGVLALETPIGPRYLQPSFTQRVWLMWTFRHFSSLPHQVLRPGERRLIDRLCGENRFVSFSTIGADWPIIGRIERRLPQVAEILPMRKPVSRAEAAAAEHSREAASA